MAKTIEIIQKETCGVYGAIYCPSPKDHILGISSRVIKSGQPIHGLRHPLSSGTTGWYIWCGDYSCEVGFFKPIHTEHINDLYPEILKFLGLPPGWRFLKAENYEDVWYDNELLKV